MPIHHLSCGRLRLTAGRAGMAGGDLVSHCLLLEGVEGLVLIDTGLGLNDVAAGKQRLHPLAMISEHRIEVSETAIGQVQNLGFEASDVRHIVLTHLDFDTAGGVADFPQAQVHVHAREFEAAQRRDSPLAKYRYRPGWGSWKRRLHAYPPGKRRWFGLEGAQELGLAGHTLMLIPLPGHTAGHCGVAIRNEHGGWLLLAGDAYFHHAQTPSSAFDKPACPPRLALYQRLSGTDHGLRRATLQTLRRIKVEHGGAVRIFCSRDPMELELMRRTQEYGGALQPRAGLDDTVPRKAGSTSKGRGREPSLP
jgi:glyoxylase-like metal-dependent hydrolase (beta-lactamase superfamily II)